MGLRVVESPNPAGLVVVTLPGLVLKAPDNRREHWRVVAKRAAAEKLATLAALSQVGTAVRAQLRAAPRLAVRFVKTGGRTWDSDNLVAGLKHVRDGLALWLGPDDGSDWYEWLWPRQEPGAVGVRLELWPLTDRGTS